MNFSAPDHPSRNRGTSPYTFGFKGHLRPGFLEDDGRVDYAPNGQFLLEIGQCEREPRQPLEEAIFAARQIFERAERPLWLCMSGGVDSECMALAFLYAKIPFKVAIQRFENDLNWYDIAPAIAFCRLHQIPFRIFDLKIIDFYHGGAYLDYAVQFRCFSPQLCTHLHLLNQIDGYPILSGNLTNIYRSESGKVLLALPDDLFFCYDRYFYSQARRGTGLFFFDTPELIYSFLRLPSLQRMLFRKENISKQGMSYAQKCFAYREGGFWIMNREDKFTGFEEVKKFFAKANNSDLTIYDRLYRDNLTRIFPPARENLFLLPGPYLKVSLNTDATIPSFT